jgi:hypothetical protein
VATSSATTTARPVASGTIVAAAGRGAGPRGPRRRAERDHDHQRGDQQRAERRLGVPGDAAGAEDDRRRERRRRAPSAATPHRRPPPAASRSAGAHCRAGAAADGGRGDEGRAEQRGDRNRPR